MKIIELFAGIGACSTALKRIGIDLEIVDAIEIDNYAMASFNAIHGTNFKTQDITTYNKTFKDIDLITHGSPCQDFSIAGKQAGGDLGSGTRSSLMYETIRIFGQVRPKYILWENVKNILSKKHKHNFDKYIETLETLGYNSYYQVLNAKDYGIPQNRERVYTVSIRKDIDKDSFKFPEKQILQLRLKDMLEDKVEEKFYLSKEIASKYTPTNESGNVIGKLNMDKWQDHMKRIYDIEKYSPAINTMQGGNLEPKIITYNIPQKVTVRKYSVNTDKLKEILREYKNYSNKEIALILNQPITTVEHWFRTDNCFSIPEPEIWLRLKSLLHIKTDEFDESIMTFEEKDGVYDKANRIYDEKGLAPTLTQQEEKILIKNATKKGYDEAEDGDSINLAYPDNKTRRGRVGHRVSQTLTGNSNMGVINNLRIRKLTPKECWRLMGFSDEDFEKAANIPTSNTQLYKQAGNSIVVNVLEKIFLNLLGENNA